MHAFSSGSRPDPLSEILRDLRLQDGSYGRCELSAPWGIDFPAQEQARFHLVVSGGAWLQRGKSGQALAAGDVVLLPRGTAHTLASQPRARSKPLARMPLTEIAEGTYRMDAATKRGARTLLVCCSVSFASPGMQPLLELMPEMLLLRGGDDARARSLGRLTEAMNEEVEAQRLGYATIMVRLADVLIATVVRDWAEAHRADTHGWLAALNDAQVGRALAAIHARPGAPWTLATLAREARTSRTVFAERFSKVVGMPPAQYLAQWRMRLAGEWLKAKRMTVAEAAGKLGYDSQAAFSRAFKRVAGRPPSALRREGIPPSVP